MCLLLFFVQAVLMEAEPCHATEHTQNKQSAQADNEVRLCLQALLVGSKNYDVTICKPPRLFKITSNHILRKVLYLLMCSSEEEE